MTDINSIQDFREGVKVVTGHDIYLAGHFDQENLAKCYIEMYEHPETGDVPDNVLNQHYRVYPGGAVIEDVRAVKTTDETPDYVLIVESQEYLAWDGDTEHSLEGLERILYEFLHGEDE